MKLFNRKWLPLVVLIAGLFVWALQDTYVSAYFGRRYPVQSVHVRHADPPRSKKETCEFEHWVLVPTTCYVYECAP